MPKRASSSTASSTAPPPKRAAAVLSTKLPDSDDLKRSAALEETLLAFGTGVPTLEASRAAACAAVEQCVASWVQDVGVAHGLTTDQAAQAGCRLIMLGSCALGVPAPGSDLDCVAVVPYFVERAAFFSADGCPRARFVTSRPRRDAYIHTIGLVPVIKFVLDGLPVDLLLARFGYRRFARAHGRVAGQGSLHGRGGCALAERRARGVRDRVPRAARRPLHHAACRRLGALSRSGPAGQRLPRRVVGRSSLLACQLHPNAALSTLLYKFFLTWNIWRFGETTPALQMASPPCWTIHRRPLLPGTHPRQHRLRLQS